MPQFIAVCVIALRLYFPSSNVGRPFNATVRAVVQTVLTATFSSYENRLISTPYKIESPKPTDFDIEKHSAFDYVRDQGNPEPRYQI